MSKEPPGVIFDASNSWNGYNHQGKLAILFAIEQILEVYDKTLSNNNIKGCIELSAIYDKSDGDKTLEQ